MQKQLTTTSKWQKLTADQQRELIGFPVFGKKFVKRDVAKGGWHVEFTTISRDVTAYFFSDARVAEMAQKREKANRNLENGKVNN